MFGSNTKVNVKSCYLNRSLETRVGKSRACDTWNSRVLELALESDTVLGARMGFRIRNAGSLGGKEGIITWQDWFSCS